MKGTQMKIMWIGGTHPRHLYYINTIHARFPLAGAIVETRESMLPQPPANIAPQDRENFIRHFHNRDEAEKRYFGEQSLPGTSLLKVQRGIDELNSQRSIDFLRQVNPDLVLIFGSGMVREPLFSALPKQKVNLHLGLSPRYRGAATLFWPFYFLEPNYAGTTFHYIVDEPDAGDVIHQVVPELSPSDGIHDVACKAVIQSAKEAVQLVELFEKDGGWKIHRQKATGKNFLASDFKPEHLRIIYDVYQDQMAKEFLEGRLESKKPYLYRQF